MALSDLDREMLAFERQQWLYPGAKEDEIRQRFDMSPTRFYQRLNVLLDEPEALETDPVLVNRLRRLRDVRRRRRVA